MKVNLLVFGSRCRDSCAQCQETFEIRSQSVGGQEPQEGVHVEIRVDLLLEFFVGRLIDEPREFDDAAATSSLVASRCG